MPEGGVDDGLPRAPMPPATAEGSSPQGSRPSARSRQGEAGRGAPAGSAGSTPGGAESVADRPEPEAPGEAGGSSPLGSRPREDRDEDDEEDEEEDDEDLEEVEELEGLGGPRPLVSTEEVDEVGAVERFGDYSTARGETFGVDLSMNGYLRFAGELTQNDEDVPFVGQNDGFKLANARLGFRATKSSLIAYISIEGAVGEGQGFNDPNPELRVGLRDAFLRFELSPFALLTAGRFKTPYDLGELKATVRRSFIDLPLESRGVLATQGFEQDGLSQDRQLGLMIHRDRAGLSEDGWDLGYALAITNGRTGDRAFNDDDTPAAFARLSLLYGAWVQVSWAGFIDRRRTGDLPDLFEEEVMGTEVSLVLDIEGLVLEAQALFQNVEFATTGRPDVFAYGGHAQVTYRLGPFEAGYRFSMLEPNADVSVDFDIVVEHGATLIVRPSDLPLTFYLNGTLAVEQQGRALDNDRLAALVQFTF